MKKLILFLSLPGVFLTLPYWTGLFAEQEFPNIQQNMFQNLNLKTIENIYQRGWFHSSTQSLVEVSSHRLLINQEIDHGFLPIQSAKILTTVQTYTNNKLLEVHTSIDIKGDMMSTVMIPAQHVHNEHAFLQWEQVEGTVYIKQDLTTIQIDMHYPQVSVETNQGNIVLEELSIQVDLQPNLENLMLETTSTLHIQSVKVLFKDKDPIILKGITLEGYNQVNNDNVMAVINVALQDLQLGTEHYGPGSTDVSLHHWHFPTMANIQKIVQEVQNQSISIQQKANILKFRLLPDGLTLLKKRPEFAMTDFSLNTPQGPLEGKLQLKIEVDNENIIAFAIFNPSILINLLNTQLEILIPQSLVSITPSLDIWLKNGLLKKTKNNAYHSHLNLKKGNLEVNGKSLPIASLYE